LWKDSTHANRLVSSSTLTTSRPILPRLASVVSSSMLASPARVRWAVPVTWSGPIATTNAQQVIA
jgi:hypothetical protein